MATPILNQVSKDLAYKLQDPVSTGTASGVRISADERLRYILRAYRRLLRLVTLLYPGLTQKLFQNYYTNTSGTTNSLGQISSLTYAEVYDLYAKQPSDEEYTKATYISPVDFIDVQTGQNKFYEPDLNKHQYYWTRVTSFVHVLPAVTLDYKLTYRADVATNVEDDGYGGAYDLDVPTEHHDLLLSFACAEAYLDTGQADMAQAYKNDVGEQLAILGAVKENKEKRDEDEEF